jgi:hypothetical protein
MKFGRSTERSLIGQLLGHLPIPPEYLPDSPKLTVPPGCWCAATTVSAQDLGSPLATRAWD